MRRLLVAFTITAATAIGGGSAFADCAEDLTRIQTTMTSASADIRDAVAGLVSTAQARAKAKDGAGCSAATNEALKLLGLVTLPPITLSTPVPGTDRQPHPPAPSASGVAAAADSGAKPPTSAPNAQPGATPSPPSPPPRAVAPDAPDQKSAAKDWYVVTSNLIGQQVTAHDRPGTSVGVIKALAIDSTTQQAVLALIETGGFLGFGGEMIAVPFSAMRFGGRWDRPEVQVNTDVLESGPRATADNVTALLADPAWRRELNGHFRVPGTAAAPLPKPGDFSSKVTAKVAPTVTPAPASTGPADAAAGHAYVKGVCAACHTFDPNGGTRVGPNLYGVFDRKIASVSGYSYSQGLKQHGGTWDAANLDAFLQSPEHFAPHTMMTFAGIPSNKQRADVIAYLKALAPANGDQK